MNAAQKLNASGQSLWLDSITRTMLHDGTLERLTGEYGITGLTSNPAIFEQAIGHGDAYDAAIRAGALAGLAGEALLEELMLADITRAADLLRSIHDASGAIDGWVSLEVSPLLAGDAAATMRAAARLHARACRPNVMIKIPGTEAGLSAIEESVCAGIPVNVTLLFSPRQYQRAAAAYMRGLERRLAAGLDAGVASVASLFVSRWDAAVRDVLRERFRNRLGIAVALRTYRDYRDLLLAPRWLGLAAHGARAQRLLWASTGTKDAAAPDTLYVEALVAAGTVNTVPEKTLLAFADHGRGTSALLAGAGHAEATLAEFAREGVDVEALGAKLQAEGVAAFAGSWRALLEAVALKSLMPPQGGKVGSKPSEVGQ